MGLLKTWRKLTQKGKVLWFTGLSGAGKSTIAEAAEAILQRQGYDVQLLDGDRLRNRFPGTGFSMEERAKHIRRVGYMASLLEAHGTIVLCTFISPSREVRGEVRSMCQDFKEIHVACPLSVCTVRDPKGLYRKALAGTIENFTGISSPYEKPLLPELTLRTNEQRLGLCVQTVVDLARR